MKKLKLISQKFLPALRLAPRKVIIFIILTLVSFIYMFAFVPLAPTVSNNFFFSSDDPQLQSEQLINKLFVRQDSQLIISAAGDINDKAYRKKISELSGMLLTLKGVVSVNSLTHSGPTFWRSYSFWHYTRSTYCPLCYALII